MSNSSVVTAQIDILRRLALKLGHGKATGFPSLLDLTDGITEGRVGGNVEQSHEPIGRDDSEDQELAVEVGDATDAQVDHAHDQAIDEILALVVRHLRARSQHPDDGAEVDDQLPRWLPGSREGMYCHDAPDPDIELA